MASYEQIFLAIASKNGLMTQDQAGGALKSFKAQNTAESKKTIEELVCGEELLTSQETRAVALAANKVMAKSAPPAPAGPAAHAKPLFGPP